MSTDSQARPLISVDFKPIPFLSLALAENLIPLVPSLALTNVSDESLENLVVELALLPNFSQKWTTHVSAIPAGGTFRIDDVSLTLDRDRLVNQVERESGQLMLWVRQEGRDTPLCAEQRQIDVLAYNEWIGRGMEQLLAAFVLPNHPVVAELLKQARTPLTELTGSPDIRGYQGHEPRHVAAVTEAIYRAIQGRGITYSNPPASFETTGQKIRTPEQIAQQQMATCLDVSVFAAAALEQAGLHAVIILLKGHAFPGVWLEERKITDGLIDDASTVRKLISLGKLLVFDSSSTVSHPHKSFDEARRIGERLLDGNDFRVLIDIAGAREQRYLPLPSRTGPGYAAVVEVQVQVPQSGPSGVPLAPTGESRSARSKDSARTRHPRVENWKQKLLDTSLRNKLLNFKDTKHCLSLVGVDVAAVEDLLASNHELKVRGRPTIPGKDEVRSRQAMEARHHDDVARTYLRERLERGEIYANQTAEETSTRLLQISRAAREALEETGTNMLCLTIGMLHWYESDSSEESRRAPILLIPVTLQRDNRTSGYTLKSSGEEARINVTLLEKIRIERGITFPELDELPLDEAGVDVPKILQIVRTAILNLKRWDVREELHIGLFSFAKFQMWADLDQNLDALLKSPVVQHILNGKRDTFPNQGAFPEPQDLDEKFSPKDLVCPLDADSSQLAAVAAASAGRTFVLQGPPGTGKSQTITNLITHAITQGKRILFVAEKAAALEVVQRRLAQIGLGHHILELHSHKSGKLQVLEQFREALEARPAATPSTWDQDAKRLLEERNHLNGYVEALHRRGASGFSIFQALGQLDALRDAPVFNLPATCAEKQERFESLQGTVNELAEALRTVGPPAQSPWNQCAITQWRVDLPSQVSQGIDAALTALDATLNAATRLAASLGANPPLTLDDAVSLSAVATSLASAPPHGPALEAGGDFARANQDGAEITSVVRARSVALTRLKQTYQDAFFHLDLTQLSQRFQKYARAFFLFAWWGLRGARKTILAVARDGKLPDRGQITSDLENALATRGQDETLDSRSTRAREIYGEAWRGADSDPTKLDSILAWGREHQRAVAGARNGLLNTLRFEADSGSLATETQGHLQELRQHLKELDSNLSRAPAGPTNSNEWEEIRLRLEGWRTDLHKLRSWHAYLRSSQQLKAFACQPLVDAVANGRLAADGLMRAFLKGAYQSWVRQALLQDPVLCAFDGDAHRKHITSFMDLDRKLLASSQVYARAQVSSRAPSSANATGGEIGILQKELQKKRGHMPIRKLLAQIPAVAPRLKPCFLMSPMSVATYLDPKAQPFDIVVFDEASQIPSHDAMGALARGSSAVVVGDTKQLPPTSFFQSGGDDDAFDDDAFEELESVLNECIASGIPERQLDWHYRSRHESLIAFSNHAYYGNRLNTFPSAMDRGEGRGVTFKRGAGFYDKGGARTNRAEAEQLVRDLLVRLRAPGANKRTYGVVTFSQAQQSLVEDLLEAECIKDHSLDPFFDKKTNPEHVVVKNLENIQGDERDVMLFSICYGPDQAGRLSMNFGPLNRDGGERRLNVAVTRAREELVVYSSLLPEHIDLTRTKAKGVKDLKTFLDYAARGPKAIAEALTIKGDDHFDSPFEQQVCERLRNLGYQVHPQVGCAGYRIDLGLADPESPGRYVLAVECDGAHYHSARSARERDRLRAQVLAGLGWKIHRIWSTDWWQNPDREIAKVREAFERSLEDLRKPPPETVAPPASPPVEITIDHSIEIPVTPPRRTALPVGSSVSAQASSHQPLYAKATTSGLAVPPYEMATVPELRRNPDDVHQDNCREETKKLLLEIVRIESPLTLRLLAKRVAPYFNIHRATNRLEERIRGILGRNVKIQNDVVWRLDQDPIAYREYREATGEAKRDAAEVPAEEIANAAAAVLRGSISIDKEELIKLTARLLGYGRTGGKVADQIDTGIVLLVKRGGAKRDGDKITLS
jgi:very-short-patch-repair endonuclease